jgi:hypothetical protein
MQNRQIKLLLSPSLNIYIINKYIEFHSIAKRQNEKNQMQAHSNLALIVSEYQLILPLAKKPRWILVMFPQESLISETLP